MQLVVHIRLKEPLSLPINYNHILQAVIYRALSIMPDYSQFLHAEDLPEDRENIKYFSLANWMENIEYEKKRLPFIPTCPLKSEVQSHC